MGVGGLIGGGIFAVLGVATDIAGNAAFLSYLLAGAIALASGYSYARMTAHLREEGGSFTFVEHYTERENVAGVVGWTLVVGYVGTMAMYAYAFGSFATGLLGVGGVPWARGAISVGVVAAFTGVNLLGVRESGESQDFLVYAKVAILLLFGGVGVATILWRPEVALLPGGILDRGVVAPVVAIGAIFVSFEGFQLLTYEYSDIAGGVRTMARGVYVSIVASTLIYVLVALVTTSVLTPEEILRHRETVLAVAAAALFRSPIVERAAYVLVSLAALFSTASAINATLFGTARLTHKVATEGALPELFSFRNRAGIPTRSLLAIAGLTVAFTALGTLAEITTFASIAFAVVFGVVNYVCLRDRDVDRRRWIPAVGLVGTASFVPLIIWHYLRTDPTVLLYVGGIVAALLALELLYFERRIAGEDFLRLGRPD